MTNNTPTTPLQEAIDETAMTFMHQIEEWQSAIEGTPTTSELTKLDRVYGQHHFASVKAFQATLNKRLRDVPHKETCHLFLPEPEHGYYDCTCGADQINAHLAIVREGLREDMGV